MKLLKLKVEYTTKSGRVLVRALPAVNVVCPSCQGTGKQLREGMRGQAFTAEDFEQDPELAENMLAGVYDVPCETCYGANVVLQVAEEYLLKRDRRFWKQVQRAKREQAQWDYEDRMERFYENGGRF